MVRTTGHLPGVSHPPDDLAQQLTVGPGPLGDRPREEPHVFHCDAIIIGGLAQSAGIDCCM